VKKVDDLDIGEHELKVMTNSGQSKVKQNVILTSDHVSIDDPQHPTHTHTHTLVTNYLLTRPLYLFTYYNTAISQLNNILKDIQ